MNPRVLRRACFAVDLISLVDLCYIHINVNYIINLVFPLAYLICYLFAIISAAYLNINEFVSRYT